MKRGCEFVETVNDDSNKATAEKSLLQELRGAFSTIKARQSRSRVAKGRVSRSVFESRAARNPAGNSAPSFKSPNETSSSPPSALWNPPRPCVACPNVILLGAIASTPTDPTSHYFLTREDLLTLIAYTSGATSRNNPVAAPSDRPPPFGGSSQSE